MRALIKSCFGVCALLAVSPASAQSVTDCGDKMKVVAVYIGTDQKFTFRGDNGIWYTFISNRTDVPASVLEGNGAAVLREVMTSLIAKTYIKRLFYSADTCKKPIFNPVDVTKSLE